MHRRGGATITVQIADAGADAKGAVLDAVHPKVRRPGVVGK